MQVDPLASSFGSQSPYNYGYNNPVLFNDVFGAEADSTGRHSAGYSVYNFPHPYNGHTWITPGSANHWSDGIGNTDWSLYGGSEMYQTGFAAGMTDIGGKLYHINSNGTRNKLTSENGRLGYHQTNAYWNGHAAVFHEYFVEVAQQGDANLARALNVAGQYGFYGEKNEINWIIDYDGKGGTKSYSPGVTEPSLTNGKRNVYLHPTAFDKGDDKLFVIMGHKYVHTLDHDRGLFRQLYSEYRSQTVVNNIFEYRAYTWSAAAERVLGLGLGQAGMLEFYEAKLPTEYLNR